MINIRLLAAIFALLAGPAAAQITLTGVGPGVKPGTVYAGPGDIVSGATAWYGLRAYTKAFATGSNPAINIRRASDNSTTDVNILNTGRVDIASATTFGGVDVTGTGAIAGGSTLTLTGAHIGDTVSGTGVLRGTIIVSGTSPTWQVNYSQSVSSTTMTARWGLYVTEFYDQTGNGNHLLQATTANQPQLLMNCIGTLPCIAFANANSQFMDVTIGTQSQPQTVSFVGERAIGLQEGGIIGGDQADASMETADSTPNQWDIYAGTGALYFTAMDATYHGANVTFNDGSSVANVDGIETSGISTGTNPIGGLMAIGSHFGTRFADIWMGEVGLWPVAFSAGNRTNVCHNQFQYWAFATAC